nr:hypothetical protein ACMD2_22841 [Ipomoea batatas]
MKQHSTIGVPIAVNSALAKDVAFFLSVAMLCASRGTEFHDMKNPVMSKTRACRNTEDGSLGNASKRIAARGIADAELICDKIIRP